MEGAMASFNPWTLLDSNDPGDVIGKAKSKEDKAASKKPAAAEGPWAPASKAMAASTPAKKKKNKKKKPAAAAANQANGKGPAGKQNGAGKQGSKNGAKSQQATATGVTERR
ncbi:hypothetical protein SEVIR_7G166900v4 [Setaria viridis]|uniref:Uncharacterized protein n=2 Tax=Setaria TaxID=4554 RepID=A0A368RWE7_SETIT|nr:hypothetical protein SETIT_7G158300v2 [Setaria italica]TKW05307.1 hypothetical protein SEVIR_7G166900v2 [Setaria viridis]